jgi:hypothetical protein
LLLTTPGVRVLEAHCYEISEYGLAACLSGPISLDATPIFVLTLPGEAITLRIQARVTNRQGVNYGFAFLFSTPAEREHVQRYLSSSSNHGHSSPRLLPSPF